MPTRSLRRNSAIQGFAKDNVAPIYVDSDDNIIKFIPAGSGTTEVQVVDSTSTQTISGDKTFTGTVVISGVATKTEFADGTVLLPSITFTDDLDSGVYRIGANNVGVTVAAAKVLDISATGLGVTGTTLSGDGTVSLPGIGFSGDTDCGVYRIGANNIGVGVAGAKVLDVSATGLAVTGTLTATQGINFNGLNPTASPISFEGVTLTNNTNAIRGASVNPTRTSGWISFSGTISTAPTQCYTDFRQLTTTGVAEVLGIGTFPTMSTGASCASAFGVQSICQVDAGATVLTASSAQGVGIYPLYGKVLIDGATVNSGAQIAAAWLSVQANVTDISGRASALVHGEVASGTLRDLFYFNATAGNLATNLFNFSASTAPIVAGGAGNATVATGNWLQVRVVVDGTAYYFPICSALWTNA